MSEYSEEPDFDDAEVLAEHDNNHDAPPGSQALHDLHDAHAAVKEAAEFHRSKVEHPGVLKEIAGTIADAEKSMENLRDAHARIYPREDGHEQPGEGDEGEAAEDKHPLEDTDKDLDEDMPEGDFEDEPGDEPPGRHRHDGGMAPGGSKSLRRKSDAAAEALRRTNGRILAQLLDLIGDDPSMPASDIAEWFSSKSFSRLSDQEQVRHFRDLADRLESGGVDLDAWRHPDLKDPFSRKSQEAMDHLLEKDNRLLGHAAMLPPDEQRRVMDALGGE